MSKYSYFSDYDKGEGEELSLVVWNGIKSVYKSYLNKNYFAESFSEIDCGKVIGTDERMLIDLLKAHNSHVISSSKIFKTKTIEIDDGEFGSDSREYIEFSPVMDFIQFLYKHFSEPIQHKNNTYIRFHYTFNSDRVIAQEEFRKEINTIFQRNKINFKLNEDGKIARIQSPFFEKLSLIDFMKNDTVLNEHLNIAYKKFQSPYLAERKIAIEKLWDASVYIKSHRVPVPRKTKQSVEELLEDILKGKPNLKDFVNTEMKQLTDLGNTGVNIRHSEIYLETIDNHNHIEYLFYRMSATIHLLLTGLNK